MPASDEDGGFGNVQGMQAECSRSTFAPALPFSKQHVAGMHLYAKRGSKQAPQASCTPSSATLLQPDSLIRALMTSSSSSHRERAFFAVLGNLKAAKTKSSTPIVTAPGEAQHILERLVTTCPKVEQMDVTGCTLELSFITLLSVHGMALAQTPRWNCTDASTLSENARWRPKAVSGSALALEGASTVTARRLCWKEGCRKWWRLVLRMPVTV